MPTVKLTKWLHYSQPEAREIFVRKYCMYVESTTKHISQRTAHSAASSSSLLPTAYRNYFESIWLVSRCLDKICLSATFVRREHFSAKTLFLAVYTIISFLLFLFGWSASLNYKWTYTIQIQTHSFTWEPSKKCYYYLVYIWDI